MRMLKLLLIRHGESTGNRDRRIAGHSDDGLTYKGQQQCRFLARDLYQQGWRPSHIYTSPLRRAVESLEHLLEPWGRSLSADLIEFPIVERQKEFWKSTKISNHYSQICPRITVSQQLAEFQAGILTGLTWAEAKHQHPILCQALETSPDWVPIPQAETPLQGRSRAQRFIQRLLTEHSTSDAVWIVSHHWIMEHLIACLMGSDRTWQIAIPNTAVFEFWIECDRWLQTGMSLGISDLWQIKRFCDCRHLNQLC